MVLEVLGAGLVSLEGGVWPPVQVELGYDVGLLLILTATDNHKFVLCGTINHAHNYTHFHSQDYET